MARFIWQFEMNIDHPLDIDALPCETESDIRWEARYFWEAHEVVVLKGLSPEHLLASSYKIKHRKDVYCVLPDEDYNLKLRHGTWFYKPCLAIRENAVGFGEKIAFTDDTNILPTGQHVPMSKEVLRYTFHTTPNIRFELARLMINKKIYWTVSFEGRSERLVTAFSNHIVGEKKGCDYVTFIKQLSGLSA